MTTVPEVRKAATKLLKARGAKARRGHLRIPVGNLFWYVDLRAEAPGPHARMRLELGCWTPALPPEPDGGAVDCPLLTEVGLDPTDEPLGEIERVVDLVTSIGDLATLGVRLPELPDPLVDPPLRALLGI